MKSNIREVGAEWFEKLGAGKAMLAVTLTTDPSKLDFKRLGKFKTDQKVKEDLNYLHCKLNDLVYGKNWMRKKLSTDIYAVREEKSGHPHIHMAVAFDDPKYAGLVGNYLKDIWKDTRCGGDFNHVTLITESAGWIDYCFKHVKNTDTDAIYACKRVIDLNI